MSICGELFARQMDPRIIYLSIDPSIVLLAHSKGVAVGVCCLWPLAEPSQNKRKRAKSLISRSVKNTISRSMDG